MPAHFYLHEEVIEHTDAIVAQAKAYGSREEAYGRAAGKDEQS